MSSIAENIPLVSIVMAAYNAQNYIGDTLDSIFSQNYRNFELIIVDDGSTDDTKKIIESRKENIEYFYQKNSGGCAVPRNAGLRQCKGKYICFSDSDDLTLPDRLAHQVAFMEENKGVGVSFCDYRNFKNGQKYPKTHFQTCESLMGYLGGVDSFVVFSPCSALLKENFGCAGTLMFRRDLLENFPGFDSTLTSCEDFHFYYRLAKKTQVGILNRVGMLRRLHENNMSSNRRRMLFEEIRSRSMLLELEADSNLVKQLKTYISNCYVSMSRLEANRGKYLDSQKNILKALHTDKTCSRLLVCSKMTIRSIFMAFGIHKPD